MWTKEKITEATKIYLENLDKCKKWFDENRTDLKSYFYQEYKNYSYDNVEKGILCDEIGFNKLINLNLDYINNQIMFIEKILSLDIVKENKFNRQIEQLLTNCLSIMENQLVFEPYNNLLFEIVYKYDFSKEFASILLLAKFSGIESNIVLIGGNGSGKSSLANALKGDDTENICVIPAQKSLYFSMNDMSMLSTRKNDLVELLLENNINKSKTMDDYSYYHFQNNQFTKLIVAMKEQYTEHLIKCEEEKIVADGEKTIFGQLRAVFEVVFPEIKLHFKSEAKDYLNCIKNGVSYHVNALSEGEKAVIYYAVSVLMAKNDSFIVVDEPETYLNPSLTNLLWDQLIKLRKDCQFIFITHSVDFVLGRSDSKIAWIKKFIYPDEWDFEFLKDEFDLPKTLMTEILGSKKPIAFCEGDDKSSIDYTVYRTLFGEDYTIIPVGNHVDVIRNCEVILDSPWLNMDTMGIVDGDHYTVEKVTALQNKNVTVLPFNEIEMFLVSEEVLHHTMKAIYPLEFQSRIDKFKEAFFRTVEKNADKIALNNATLNVNEFIAKEKIQDSNSITAIEENLKVISEYNVREIYDGKNEQITQIVEKKNYPDLLVVCNLKKEITRGLANKYLDNNYEAKAIQHIQFDEELQELIKSKYFA